MQRRQILKVQKQRSLDLLQQNTSEAVQQLFLIFSFLLNLSLFFFLFLFLLSWDFPSPKDPFFFFFFLFFFSQHIFLQHGSSVLIEIKQRHPRVIVDWILPRISNITILERKTVLLGWWDCSVCVESASCLDAISDWEDPVSPLLAWSWERLFGWGSFSLSVMYFTQSWQSLGHWD